MVSDTHRIVSPIVFFTNRTIVEAIVVLRRYRTLSLATAGAKTVVTTAVGTVVKTAVVLRIRSCLCPKSNRIVRLEDGYE